MADSLPIIPVPLTPPDADAELDLQLAFTRVYDGVGYDLLLNYRQQPAVALDDQGAQWAMRLLGGAK